MIATFRDPVLLAGTLEACLQASGSDQTRPHLSRVRVEITDGIVARFVATDGHWLFVNELSLQEKVADASFCITRETAKGWLRTIQTTKKAASWNVELDLSQKTLRQLVNVNHFDFADDQFPPYREVIPSFDGYQELGAPALDSQILLKVMQAFLAASGDKKRAAAVKFWMRPDTKVSKDVTCPEPVIVTAHVCPALARALAIVMPMRANVCSASELVGHYKGSTGKSA